MTHVAASPSQSGGAGGGESSAGGGGEGEGEGGGGGGAQSSVYATSPVVEVSRFVPLTSTNLRNWLPPDRGMYTIDRQSLRCAPPAASWNPLRASMASLSEMKVFWSLTKLPVVPHRLFVTWTYSPACGPDSGHSKPASSDTSFSEAGPRSHMLALLIVSRQPAPVPWIGLPLVARGMLLPTEKSRIANRPSSHMPRWASSSSIGVEYWRLLAGITYSWVTKWPPSHGKPNVNLVSLAQSMNWSDALQTSCVCRNGLATFAPEKTSPAPPFSISAFV